VANYIPALSAWLLGLLLGVLLDLDTRLAYAVSGLLLSILLGLLRGVLLGLDTRPPPP
jgi:hypothetical protein